jgi:hypothetical protein
VSQLNLVFKGSQNIIRILKYDLPNETRLFRWKNNTLLSFYRLMEFVMLALMEGKGEKQVELEREPPGLVWSEAYP